MPRPGEVIVEVHAAPVNFVDLLVVAGAYQFLPESAVHARQGPGRRGLRAGPGVEHLHVGDRVLAMAEQGGYAEKVAVAADQCYRAAARTVVRSGRRDGRRI